MVINKFLALLGKLDDRFQLFRYTQFVGIPDMPLTDNPKYKELCQQGNQYLAVMQLAEETRKICDNLPNRILESTALDFAARGEIPNPKDFPDYRLNRVKEYLKYVDDIEIKSAVLKSYEQSLAKNNLVYYYNTVEDEPRRSRIRIIMNILWDQRPHKKY